MSRIAATREAESNDLELHVSLCTERYEELTDKLEAVEAKCVEITETLNDIKLSFIEVSQDSKYLKWCIGIITALSGALLHVLFK